MKSGAAGSPDPPRHADVVQHLQPQSEHVRRARTQSASGHTMIDGGLPHAVDRVRRAPATSRRPVRRGRSSDNTPSGGGQRSPDCGFFAATVHRGSPGIGNASIVACQYDNAYKAVTVAATTGVKYGTPRPLWGQRRAHAGTVAGASHWLP
jgi:hypothetical protein